MNVERIFNINTSETLDSACKVLMELQLEVFLEQVVPSSETTQKEVAA